MIYFRTCAYNAEKTIRRTVESVLSQTIPDFKYYILDNGSTDSTRAIIDEYAKQDQRIVVVHKKNQGQALARKSGMEIAAGEYITFVDADDYIDIDAYEKIANNINRGLPDIIAFDLLEEYPDKTVKKENTAKSCV